MNIAMVVYSHYSRDARVRRYAESLARSGFRVDVICLKENYQPKEANISLIQYPLGRRRYGKLWYVIEYLMFFLYCAFILALMNFVKRYKIIHIHNMPDLLVFTAVIPKLFGTKVILDLHDPMPELYMSKYHVDNNCLMVKWLEWLEKISIGFADQIITANEVFKYIFLTRLHLVQGVTLRSNKISVILNCPDERIFNPTNDQRPTTNDQYFNLLYMGTVEERFGLDIALEAMPQLIKKIPNLRFIIIPKLEDEGKYFKNLKFRIKNLELNKYIKIFPPQPLEKIAQKLKEADIGIVLAQNGKFTDSIIPVKLLELIAMEVPVIATETLVLSRIFTSEQICFLRRNTSKDFANAVSRLWKDPRLRRSLTREAKDYLKVNNWQREEKKYIGLINLLRNKFGMTI